MKILQVCHRVPFPPIDGGNFAIISIGQSLIKSGSRIKMFALNTTRHFIDIDKLPEVFRSQTNIEGHKIDTSIKIIPAFLNLFSSKSYNISRFCSKEVEQKLIELLKKGDFDVIQLESLFTAPYITAIRKNSKAKIVLRAHNVEFLIWQRMRDACKSRLKRKYLAHLAANLKKYELKMLNVYDAILPVTQDDANVFMELGCRIPIFITPIGADVSVLKKLYNENPELCLFHLGSMDWMPNVEAVEWFLKNCLDEVSRRFPMLKIYFAGRGMPDHLKELGNDNTVFIGTVEQGQQFIQSRSIMIVPLLSGSGMRVKIIQGMAMGKAIISTTIGAEGIAYTNEKNILIADTAEEFVAAIEKCVKDKSFCKRLGLEAMKLAEEKYSNEAIGKSLYVFYKRLVEEGKRSNDEKVIKRL